MSKKNDEAIKQFLNKFPLCMVSELYYNPPKTNHDCYFYWIKMVTKY